MKKLLYVGLFLLINISLAAQNEFKIKGVVTDSITHEKIPYCSVYIQNTTIGVITNMDGAFQLQIPPEYENSDLIISCVGYNSYEKEIKLLKLDNAVNFVLIPCPVNLEQINIVETKITALDIVNMAIDSISKNYCQNHYSGIAYYCDKMVIKKGGRLYKKEIEAIIQANFTAYKKISREYPMGKLLALKKQLDTIILMRMDIVPMSMADIAVNGDVVKIKSMVFDKKKNKKNYTFNLDGYVYQGNDTLYKISFTDFVNSNDELKCKGMLLIKKNNYFISEFHYYADINDGKDMTAKGVYSYYYQQIDNTGYLFYKEILRRISGNNFFIYYIQKFQNSNISFNNIYKISDDENIYSGNKNLFSYPFPYNKQEFEKYNNFVIPSDETEVLFLENLKH